jgi:hypothetical protein
MCRRDSIQAIAGSSSAQPTAIQACSSSSGIAKAMKPLAASA